MFIIATQTIFSHRLCVNYHPPPPSPGTSRGSYPFSHSASPYLHPRLYRGCYGDIMTMETPGTACDITRLINCGKWKAKQTFGLSPFIISRFFLRKIASFWKRIIIIIVLMLKLKMRKQNSDQPNILLICPPPHYFQTCPDVCFYILKWLPK